jgi:uncharacterized protein
MVKTSSVCDIKNPNAMWFVIEQSLLQRLQTYRQAHKSITHQRIQQILGFSFGTKPTAKASKTHTGPQAHKSITNDTTNLWVLLFLGTKPTAKAPSIQTSP